MKCVRRIWEEDVIRTSLHHRTDIDVPYTRGTQQQRTRIPFAYPSSPRRVSV